MLSDSLTEVTIHDIEWAVKQKYETDTKWIALNLVSLLSNKSKLSRNKREFKELVGYSLYSSKISPMCNWSGSYKDLIKLVSVISNKHITTVESDLNSLIRNESSEYSIRLRKFSHTSKNPLYGESVRLNKDDNGNFYMWMYDSRERLIQVPEQMLKEQLIFWDNI